MLISLVVAKKFSLSWLRILDPTQSPQKSFSSKLPNDVGLFWVDQVIIRLECLTSQEKRRCRYIYIYMGAGKHVYIYSVYICVYHQKNIQNDWQTLTIIASCDAVCGVNRRHPYICIHLVLPIFVRINYNRTLTVIFIIIS